MITDSCKEFIESGWRDPDIAPKTLRIVLLVELENQKELGELMNAMGKQDPGAENLCNPSARGSIAHHCRGLCLPSMREMRETRETREMRRTMRVWKVRIYHL
ncbi:hypothetical protein LENED_003432 [Lentinula edodes]|uniref:Uncharacterized protein n=1 Tax=Lentinula edodes TaxID=5353 RepID=A0A1Q3E3H9_LENED|nr:hypothetical protein LENED_003432 [Lentinula edodes]